MKLAGLIALILLPFGSSEITAQTDADPCVDERCVAAVAAEMVYLDHVEERYFREDLVWFLNNVPGARLPDRSIDWSELLPDRLPEEYRAYLAEVATRQAFAARLFLFGDRLVLAFRGSDDQADWTHNNIPHAVGIIPFQYSLAQQLRWHIDEALREQIGTSLILAGHSLGGGLATYASIGGEDVVWTFNPARTNQLINSAAAAVPEAMNRVRLTNVVVEGDPVSQLHVGGTPLGEDILIPFVRPDGAGSLSRLNPFAPHVMGAVLRGLGSGSAIPNTGSDASCGSSPWTWFSPKRLAAASRTGVGTVQCYAVNATLTMVGLFLATIMLVLLKWVGLIKLAELVKRTNWLVLLGTMFAAVTIGIPMLIGYLYVNPTIWFLIPVPYLLLLWWDAMWQAKWLKAGMLTSLTVMLVSPHAAQQCLGVSFEDDDQVCLSSGSGAELVMVEHVEEQRPLRN